ncbi:ATP-binding protein [uncultured Oscillibacter sp.]|uniref:ATP-binding protein n=1 Tax=uncultured Oscillibacter sp. TaxID=876091 RepID=UPI0026299F2C|nr:SbcC/MukB-like Walker B domain-containing protein [uncultured Oscillibacter sp.]
MKKLKKILLINWLYFSKQLIEVEDINFLTGKNGAGKSTVIDALQIVLLGEMNARNFNQAANEKSQRTLDGYLRADMDSNSPYSRRGKDFSSYIACEFWDEEKGSAFVTGIVFDCRSDGSRQERFFIYDGTIPEGCFLEGQEAMDIPSLRVYLKQQYSLRQKLYDSHKEYRTDMLAKWNVHNEQVSRMLKKAVSFRPIADIQKFITENICDIPDKPDIEAMQQNIRDYKRHEQLAQRQEEKLKRLHEISRLYGEMQSAIDRWNQQTFLVLWAHKEDLEGRIAHYEAEKQDCEAGAKKATAEFAGVSEEIDRKRRRQDELKAACVQSSVAQEENRLRGDKDRLQREQASLLSQLRSTALEIRREADLLCGLCQKISEWKEVQPLRPVIQMSVELQRTYAKFLNCGEQIFVKPATLFEQAQETSAEFMNVVRNTSFEIENILSHLQAEQDQRNADLANLRKNIKDYPRGLTQLRDRLSAELDRQCGQDVQIDILADVLEIPEMEEPWRGAVEGYLNAQKFYLLVPPKHYQRALAFYNQIKQDYGGHSFGLVDIAKLQEKEHIVPQDGSLARKIETGNDLARTYIDYLLGRVVCCSHVSELRKHRTAITADGMLYQGYVVRPLRKDLMANAFIGRRAVALRISRLEVEWKAAKEEIDAWLPIAAQLKKQGERDVLFNRFFVQSTVEQRRADYQQGLEITKELERLETELSGLDLFWLEEQRRQINLLEREIGILEKQKQDCTGEEARLRERIRRLEYEELPNLYQQLNAREDDLREQFTQDFVDNIGRPRYQQEFTRLKRASAVAKNFGDRLVQTQNEQRISQQKLFQARADYVSAFQPCSFRTDAMTNDEFEQEQKFLEESELPKYREKIKAARESAMEQFQNDFLAKLKSSIEQVQDQVKSLNKALKQTQFGTDRYQFRADRSPDYAEYYDMIMSPELMEGEGGLFAMPFQQKYGPLIEELFGRLAMSDDTQLNARKQSELQQNIERYTDFRTYLKFDLETTDQNGSKQLLSQTLNTKSGGETQTPFYIAVLASFAQLYQVNNLSPLASNTVRLVVFDEAFNKMDSDRIIESVRLLRKMGLQAIICTPPDKLPDIMPLADKTLLVLKEKYQMHVMPWRKEMGC